MAILDTKCVGAMYQISIESSRRFLIESVGAVGIFRSELGIVSMLVELR